MVADLIKSDTFKCATIKSVKYRFFHFPDLPAEAARDHAQHRSTYFNSVIENHLNDVSAEMCTLSQRAGAKDGAGAAGAAGGVLQRCPRAARDVCWPSGPFSRKLHPTNHHRNESKELSSTRAYFLNVTLPSKGRTRRVTSRKARARRFTRLYFITFIF